MRLAALLLLLLAWSAAAPALAQQPEWRQAREYDVLLSPFAYEPAPIRLEADRPVRLRFVNQGQATYSFSAPAFFRAARIRPGDDRWIRDGRVRIAPGEHASITLVPAAGRYRARSGNWAHRLLGMSVRILVD